MESLEHRLARTTRWAPIGRWASRIVVLVAIAFSVVALGSGIEGDESTNSVVNLPAEAESARADALQESLGTSESTPVFVVFDRGGDELTAEDRKAIGAKVGELQEFAAEGQETFPVFAEDDAAAFIGVPLAADTPDDEFEEPVSDIRETASADLPDGLQAQATGGPAFSVDLSKVFDGADIRLLVTTAGVVALLLLLTYRSPWLWLVPLTVVGVADQVAVTAVDLGSRLFPFTVDGQSTGITSVLVFGAGTNYALLLIARYREELRREESRYDAMRVAWTQAAPAILASSGTVVLALLCLGFADSPSSRNIGYGGAIGLVVAVVYALVVLPAAMTLFGRRLFWPFVPRVGQANPAETGVWSKVASVVTGRPVLVSVAAMLVLAALALPLAGLKTGLSQTEQFRATPDSVTGQEVLAEHFPAGASQPTTILTPDAAAQDVRRAVADLDEVEQVDEGGSADGTSVLTAVLAADPSSDEAFDTVRAIRDAAQEVEPDVLVGGPDAQSLDSKIATDRDQRLIMPMILGVVLIVLLVLLRSVVAAVVLVLTVVASFVASLGASWWAFTHWFGFPALDLSVLLLSFLFLVALGVDYNIFLTTRAKEEAARHDTKRAISVALAVTGGVITSAGILLASVFAVLGVLPLIVLTQVGVIVGFGVLLDTLLVRSVLVPALVSLLGRRFWWPGALSRQGGGGGGGEGVAEDRTRGQYVGAHHDE